MTKRGSKTNKKRLKPWEKNSGGPYFPLAAHPSAGCCISSCSYLQLCRLRWVAEQERALQNPWCDRRQYQQQQLHNQETADGVVSNGV
eukprot:4470332-Amphidinium_carterae.1